MNELLMIWPARRLWRACQESGIRLSINGRFIPPSEEWLLQERPTPDFWCRNQFGVLTEEIAALHRALWERGDRMQWEVRRVDQTFGASPATLGFEFSVTD